MAFYIGRILLYEKVKNAFAKNGFALLEKSITKKPIRSALFMRYSSFPQLVKNFGLAVLPLHPFIFAMAIFVHGVPYSLLWSFIGAETKNRLSIPVSGASPSSPSRLYEKLLFFSGLFGIFGSPAIVAYWIRDMKKDSEKEN